MFKTLNKKIVIFPLATFLVITLIVITAWQEALNNNKDLVRESVLQNGKLISKEFKNIFKADVSRLENLKNRIEFTNGLYLDYWEKDASMLLEQNQSFKFLEWIDSAMVIRKINPLKRVLKSYAIWVTGLCGEQSENRSHFKVFEYDPQFEIIKFNPLMNWTRQEVLDYLKSFNIPQNSLHNQGYVSIGCAPCTRAVKVGEPSRAGRWWWESSHKECGLHLSKE